MVKYQNTTALIKKLEATLFRQRLVLFLSGAVSTAAAVGFVWIALSLLANVMVLPVWLKLSLTGATGGFTLYWFWRCALQRLFHGSVDSVAVALEERNAELRGRLIAAVQFSRSAIQQGYSRELIEATQQQALGQAGSVDFDAIVSFNPLWKTGRYFLTATAMAVALLLVSPGLFGYAFEVFSQPTTRVAPPVAYRVAAFPESTEWIKYRDIRIGGAVVGERIPEKAYIHHRPAGGNWQVTKVDLGVVNRTKLIGGDSLEFGITLRQVNRSFDFFIEAGELSTAVHRVDVVDRPRVSGLKLSVFYPAYTGLPPSTVDEMNGSFSAVVGSRVNLKIATNLPCERAELVFADSSRAPLKVDGKSAEGSLVVETSRAYRIELLDHLGETNPDPIEYYITAVPDEFPSIDVARPGYDVNLGDEMILPLLVRIYDDYGFASLVMKYTVYTQGRASEEHVAVLHFSDKIKTEGDVEFNWDMDQLDLLPGDWVSYFFEVADNDAVSGPKITQSRSYIARVPSLDEIVAQTERESIERIDKAEDLIRTGKDLARRLKEAARKLDAQQQQSQNTDWQNQKELASITEQNSEMLQNVQKMAEDMEKSLERMQDNSLMSREIVEKLSEIQKLFQEIATEEMWEAQRKLMEALQQMDPEQLQQAMQDMQLSQEELLERLERTLALLKRMQAQQKMEAMLRKAEELAERQAQTNQDTETAPDVQLPQLSQTEEKTAAGLEDLKADAKELRELMKEAGMEGNPEAEKFASAPEQTEAGQNMSQMAQELKQQNKSAAHSQGKQAHSKLMEMLDQMQQAQLAMNADDSEKMKREMRKVLDHANHLSMDQEELIDRTQTIDPNSSVLHDVAVEQLSLSSSCQGLKERVAQLGKESPFIAAEVQQLITTAIGSMEIATEGLDTKQSSAAAHNQREAMYNLNRAATRLMESLNEQSQCNNPKPDMAKMESLCNKQNQLNQQTQSQCNNPGQCESGKPGQGAGKPGQMPQLSVGQDGVRRLAGEQGAIRKSLEQLQQEFGGSRQILGRLSDIAQEMKQVEEDMSDGQVGPETAERQLRIYSRMLEATRSMQRKDFSEQRRATSAENPAYFAPPALPAELLDDRVGFEDRLKRFLGNNYPPQYEEQIKAYFRALMSVEAQQRSGAASQGGQTTP